MNGRGVDPRDIEREERAVYRVNFWSAGRTVCDEFELTDAVDLHEVLRWIDANADGREVEALVVVDGCDVRRGAVLGSCAVYHIGPLDQTGSTTQRGCRPALGESRCLVFRRSPAPSPGRRPPSID